METMAIFLGWLFVDLILVFAVVGSLFGIAFLVGNIIVWFKEEWF